MIHITKIAGNQNLTEGTPWKQILVFALPVFLGILLQQLYNTADTIIVGNYKGEAALAAVGTTGCFTFMFLALANGFSAGAGVIVAQLFGAKKEAELRKNASTAILLMLGMGAASSFLGFTICGVVLKYVLAVSDNLLAMATTYFRIYAAGLIFQFGYNIVAALLRAVGDSKATMWFLIIASILNIILDIIFVALLHWGVAGAAIATDIAQAGSCIVGFIYMYRKYPLLRYQIRELTFCRKDAARILSAGFPMALQQLIVSFGFIFIQRAVNGYGDTMTASFTVGQKVEQYLHMPTSSLQITMATFAGQNIGAGKIERVTKGGKQAVFISVILTFIFSAITIALAKPISGLFGIEENAVSFCVQHIRAAALTLIMLSSYFPLLGLFQGAGNGFAATIVAMAALTVRVIVTYTLCYMPFFGYTIIWWNPGFGFLVGGTMTWAHFLRGKWKQKKLIV